MRHSRWLQTAADAAFDIQGRKRDAAAIDFEIGLEALEEAGGAVGKPSNLVVADDLTSVGRHGYSASKDKHHRGYEHSLVWSGKSGLRAFSAYHFASPV